MLPGVLLSMVTATVCIYPARNGVAWTRGRTFDNMQHAFVFSLQTLYHAGRRQRAGVSGLAAARRVKRCAV